jgi:RNA polymerase sigma factor for flagellar operon FliA
LLWSNAMTRLRAARLAESHRDLPRRAAAIVYRRVHPHVDFDELVALGNVGLVEAAARFDPDRGISFPAFAWHRVQGAIIDGVRRLTSLPRRAWRQLVALRAASAYLEHHAATETQDTTEPLDKLRDAMTAIRTMYMISLEAIGEDEVEPFHTSTDEVIDLARLSVRLRTALEALPEDERALMFKHYWEGKQLATAGGELGISRSWSSRLHSRAIERLRTAMS